MSQNKRVSAKKVNFKEPEISDDSSSEEESENSSVTEESEHEETENISSSSDAEEDKENEDEEEDEELQPVTPLEETKEEEPDEVYDYSDDSDNDELKDISIVVKQKPRAAELAQRINIIKIVDPEDRRTSSKMTLFELAAVLGSRAEHLNAGAEPYVDITGLTETSEMALREIYEKKCPLSIRRDIGDGRVEIWHVNEMIIPKNYDLGNDVAKLSGKGFIKKD